MTFEYVEFDDAISRGGLRMVVVGGVPSPWSEAAKCILHVKKLEWVATRLVHGNEALNAWAGQRSGPVLVLDDEAPLSNWKDILLLAERLAPDPSLLPADGNQRSLVLNYSHDICADGGLGWMRRLQLVHDGLQGNSGIPERVAAYLGKKYGYAVEDADTYGGRIADILNSLAERLHTQQKAGSNYYVGNALTALDIYSATAMAMFDPLPPSQCAMDPVMRAAFNSRDSRTGTALDPILVEHRNKLYAKYLELPLQL